MMKNLGKVAVLLCMMLNVVIFASVDAKITTRIAYEGDRVRYTIMVDDERVKKPYIREICGERVYYTATKTNLEMINTRVIKQYSFVYDFDAKKSCTIPPFEVQVGDKIEKTPEVKLIVKKASEQKNRPFILEYSVDKKDLYVGETFLLKLRLMQHISASVIDSKFEPSSFQGFWIKKEFPPKRSENGEYIVTEVQYALAPQREGNLTIEPAKIQVASRSSIDEWGLTGGVQWKTYASNEIHLHVKPLPNGVGYIGDFTIEAKADKTQIHVGEAVNVEVIVKGDGNLEDVVSFKPYIDGVNVFEEKPVYKDNTLRQRLTFVSDRDFEIPPFSLRYFDVKTKKIKTIQTKPIKIDVVGVVDTQKQKPELVVKKGQTQKSLISPTQKSDTNYMAVVFAWIVGVFMGVFIVVAMKSLQQRKQQKNFNLKDKKMLLVKLLPYKDADKDVAHIIASLEDILYNNKQVEIDKHLLKEVLRRYDIS